MYAAILFAPDGDWVTDYHDCETIEQVQERLANQGSRWYFYPIQAVIRSHTLTRGSNRIVDACEPYEFMKGRTIRSMSAVVAETSQAVLGALC